MSSEIKERCSIEILASVTEMLLPACSPLKSSFKAKTLVGFHFISHLLEFKLMPNVQRMNMWLIVSCKKSF